MSLDIAFVKLLPTDVCRVNITHNLAEMAAEAALYEPMWHPERVGITKATELLPYLQAGLDALVAEPERFRPYNPINGWGSYEVLVSTVRSLIAACIEHPDAMVEAER